MKKIVYVDMDEVLCDFNSANKEALENCPKQKYPQAQWGFFLKLKPLKDAITSYKLLETYYDVRILTRPSFKNVNSFTEKAQWIWDNLGFEALEKSNMCGDKSKLIGDFLVDDGVNAKQEEFTGELIRFGSEEFPDWSYVVKYLLEKFERNDKY